MHVLTECPKIKVLVSCNSANPSLPSSMLVMPAKGQVIKTQT